MKKITEITRHLLKYLRRNDDLHEMIEQYLKSLDPSKVDTLTDISRAYLTLIQYKGKIMNMVL